MTALFLRRSKTRKRCLDTARRSSNRPAPAGFQSAISACSPNLPSQTTQAPLLHTSAGARHRGSQAFVRYTHRCGLHPLRRSACQNSKLCGAGPLHPGLPHHQRRRLPPTTPQTWWMYSSLSSCIPRRLSYTVAQKNGTIHWSIELYRSSSSSRRSPAPDTAHGARRLRHYPNIVIETRP